MDTILLIDGVITPSPGFNLDKNGQPVVGEFRAVRYVNKCTGFVCYGDMKKVAHLNLKYVCRNCDGKGYTEILQ